MQRIFLAIDIGASSGRHIVGIEADGALQTDEVYRFPNGVQRENGHLIWDIEGIFQHVKAGIKAAFAKYPHIDSLSIDTWAVDYVLLKDGAAILPCHAYRDERTQAVIDEVHQHMPFAELYRRTGHSVPAFQQHLSAVRRQKGRAAGAGRRFPDDPGISALEALRREGPRVHQCYLHRPCQRTDQGV